MKYFVGVSGFAAIALATSVASAQAVGVSGSVQVGGAPPPPPVAQPAPVAAAPAQPVYAQPVYQQPVYQQPVYYTQPQPRRAYEQDYAGGPVPQGSHIENRPRIGLIVGGAALFGATWFPTVFALAFQGSEFVAIPIVGPMIGGAQDLASSDAGLRFVGVWGIIDGLAQAGGLAMLIVGAALPRRVIVADYASREPSRDTARWALTPGVAGSRGIAPGATLSIVNF